MTSYVVTIGCRIETSVTMMIRVVPKKNTRENENRFYGYCMDEDDDNTGNQKHVRRTNLICEKRHVQNVTHLTRYERACSLLNKTLCHMQNAKNDKALQIEQVK